MRSHKIRGSGDENGPTFAHCAHAQIRESDGVAMLLQSTSSRPSAS